MIYMEFMKVNLNYFFLIYIIIYIKIIINKYIIYKIKFN